MEVARLNRSGAPARGTRWQPSRKTLRLRLYVGLLLLDMVCIAGSFALVHMVYAPTTNRDWVSVIAVLLPVYLLLAFNFHAYSVDVLRSAGRAIARAVQPLMMALVAVLLIAFFLKSTSDISRIGFAIGTGLALCSLAIGRAVFVRRSRAILGGNPYGTVLITDGAHPTLSGDFDMVVATDTGVDPDAQHPEMYDHLASLFRDADRVVVACGPERRRSWAHALKGANVQSEIVAHELLDMAPLGLSSLNGVPTMIVANGPLGKIDTAMKRGFDMAVAGAALLMMAPVLLLVAAAIRLDSDGPVFFVQKRIGQGNRQFRMFKFRSMRVEQSDSAGNRSASRDDKRITRVGAIIRKSSIDELPQLINVLRGDMSIVGPRPHALGSRAADKLFWEVDGRYWHRHAAKPGLTGLAQVRGYRGATPLEADLTNRLQADLEYLRDWSIWRDLKIIVLTFRVLVHRNAY